MTNDELVTFLYNKPVPCSVVQINISVRFVRQIKENAEFVHKGNQENTYYQYHKNLDFAFLKNWAIINLRKVVNETTDAIIEICGKEMNLNQIEYGGCVHIHRIDSIDDDPIEFESQLATHCVHHFDITPEMLNPDQQQNRH